MLDHYSLYPFREKVASILRLEDPEHQQDEDDRVLGHLVGVGVAEAVEPSVGVVADAVRLEPREPPLPRPLPRLRKQLLRRGDDRLGGVPRLRSEVNNSQ